MTVRVEIDGLRLSGVDLPAGGVDRLRGDLQHAIAAELAPVASVPREPIAPEQLAAGVRRAVAASFERRGG